MASIIEQGTEEGLGLLGGIDLAAPTPDLPKPEEFSEDRTFLGVQVVPAAQRAKIKLAREQQNVAKLNSMFDISSKVIGQAHTRKKGPEREGFLKNVLPRVERVYPGIGKQIRAFSDDPARFQELGEKLKDPKEQAIFKSLGSAGRFEDAIKYASQLSTKGKGSSEFERLIEQQQIDENITASEAKDLKKKRVGVLAGSEMRRGPERSLEFRQSKQRQVFTKRLRDEATEGTEHFSTMETNISDALGVIASGDNQLVDSLLATITSQITDPDIRAMALFTQFDKSYGNVAERTLSTISRFIGGGRSESDIATIQETLENFRDAHVKPGINKLKTQYRNLATEEGADPFRVVPPKTPEEIRDYSGITRDEKLRLLKVYFPEMFKGKPK